MTSQELNEWGARLIGWLFAGVVGLISYIWNSKMRQDLELSKTDRQEAAEDRKKLANHAERITALEHGSVSRDYFDSRLDGVRDEIRDAHKEMLNEIRAVHKRIDDKDG